MKSKIFLALSVIGCLMLPALSHSDEVKDDRYIFVNGGMAIGIPPFPVAGISYMRLIGNHALDTTFSIETAFIVTLLGGSVEYQYHFTPEFIESWFVGVGAQAYVYNDLYLGPKVSIGKMVGLGSTRIMFSLAGLKMNRKFFVEPKLEYSIRINAPK